ncbi:MAG: hypothetical protein GY913_18285 [Proteobacteria bacterium]|nr:hypothetical protein [Pseudomonadota bacterium]
MTRVMHHVAGLPLKGDHGDTTCGARIGPGFPDWASVSWAQVNCPRCTAALEAGTDADTDTGADFGSLLSMLADARATLERRPRPLAEHRKTGEAFDAVIAALGGLYAS